MKKYTSGAFQSTTYGIYKSAQDTITSFPASIIADGENASAVIYGNMQQSGTPTPSSPIYPTECGDIVASGDHTGEYVLPIICGGVTTDIFLSSPLRKIDNSIDLINSNSITRYIAKVVLNGEENWTNNSVITGGYGYYSTSAFPGFKANSNGVCSHYTRVTSLSAAEGIIYGSNINIISNFNDGLDTASKFKDFLRTEYSNNTPVTVWYILSEATTTTISTVSIPTTAGSQTFNIDTTLKPSSVSLTYTGWHTHADKQYSGGSWGQVTSNAKVLRRKKSAKSKT